MLGLSVLKKMYKEQYGEHVHWCWGVEGYGILVMFHCVVNNHSVQAAHSTIVHTILHSINRLLLSLNWRLVWQFMAGKVHNMHSSQEFYTIPWTLLNPGPHNSQESNKTKTCISCDVLLSSHLIEMFFTRH